MTATRQLLHNTLANWAGLLLPPFIALAMVPVYLAFLGLEPYGLIGAFSALVLLLGIFSQGISQALQREFARRDQDPEQRVGLRRLARTFERVYLAMGVAAGAGIALSAGWISREWIRDESLPPALVEAAIHLLAARIMISFPQGVYSAIFIGTQRQVQGNVILVAFAVAGALTGAALVIATRSILLLYAGEVLVAACLVATLRRRAFRMLPAEADSDPARFSRAEVRSLAGISAGLIWTSGVGVVITQLDRVLLSRLVSLADLAVYNAAQAGGRLISLVYMPYLTAAFPRTCKLAAARDGAGLTRHVLQNAAVVSTLTAACATPLVFFAEDVLWVWTRQPAIRDAGAPIMAIYALGSMALSNASVFYMLQMALGAVRPAVVFNAVALAWYPAAMYALIQAHGMVGAAWAWLAYGIITWLFMMTVSFARQLERGGCIAYVRRAFGPVVLAALTAPAAARLAQDQLPDWPLLRVAVAALLAALLVPGGLLLALGRRECALILGRLIDRRRTTES